MTPGSQLKTNGAAARSPGPKRGADRTLALRTQQRVRRVELRLLRRITTALLQETWPGGGLDLAIHLVAAPEMTRLNETFLRHKGSTDVVTFDYAEPAGREKRASCPALLHGEVFVCLDEAVTQARRFRVTWQSELVRYVVHGVLHLLGYDDLNPRARRRMKAAENRLMRRLDRQFAIPDLGSPVA